MSLSDLHSRIFRIASTRSRTEKTDILREIKGSEDCRLFINLCQFMFNPYKTIGVTVPKITDTSTREFETDPRQLGIFYTLLDDLCSRELTGNAARSRIADILRRCEPCARDIFQRVLSKDWKAGLGLDGIRAVFPEVDPPRFDIALCQDLDESKIDLSHEWYVEPKIDGIRGVLGNLDGSGFKAWSRGGRDIWNAESMVNFLAKKYPGHVFDGEFYAGSHSKTMSICKTQGEHPDKGELRFYIFDVVRLDQWLSRDTVDLSSRKQWIYEESLYEDFRGVNIEVNPWALFSDLEQIRSIAQEYLTQGYEGIVLKDPASRYSFTRNSDWLRWKPFLSADCPIVEVCPCGYRDRITMNVKDALEPTDDSADYDEVLRQIIIEHEGVRTAVGYGYSLRDRMDLWKQRDSLLGKIMEVKYQCLASNGALRFPTFMRMREDKE